jgi:hypothetical protein
MKPVYNKELKACTLIPETAMEAVEQLEEFLIADFGQTDWSPKFLAMHFKICKDQITKIQKRKEQSPLTAITVILIIAFVMVILGRVLGWW